MLSVFKEPLFQALDLNDGNEDDVKLQKHDNISIKALQEFVIQGQ